MRFPVPRLAVALMALSLAALAAPAAAQTADAPTAPAPAAAPVAAPAAAPASPPGFVPQTGQPGKDVIWVPTPQPLVDRMLDMVKLAPGDMVIDLGAGDGRTVITAALRGNRAHGIEYNPDMVALARRNAQAAGVADRATFAQADIFASDFSQASVITLFLLPHLNLKLRPILLDMKPGTRVVSNAFEMADWQADATFDGDEVCGRWCRAYMWVVPAKVAGDWTMDGGTPMDGGVLQLNQTFQMLDGSLTRDGRPLPISEARMDGSAIRFSAGGRRYSGVVDGDRIQGTVQGGGPWQATRAAR